MIVSHFDTPMIEFLTENRQKYYVTTDNPTSEHLAKIVFDQAKSMGLPITSAMVMETCTCEAIYVNTQSK